MKVTINYGISVSGREDKVAMATNDDVSVIIEKWVELKVKVETAISWDTIVFQDEDNYYLVNIYEAIQAGHNVMRLKLEYVVFSHKINGSPVKVDFSYFIHKFMECDHHKCDYAWYVNLKLLRKDILNYLGYIKRDGEIE